MLPAAGKQRTMFDFVRNLGKSADDKRQERLNAYVDGALSPAARQQFEQEMAQDAALRAAVAQLQQIKATLRALPPRPVPRNFMLDPALYGRPAGNPAGQWYPVLRAATALSALLFVVVLVLNLFLAGGSAPAMSEMAVQDMVETTRVVTGAEEAMTKEMETTATENADAARAEEAAVEEAIEAPAPMATSNAADLAAAAAPTTETAATDESAAATEAPPAAGGGPAMGGAVAAPTATATLLPTPTTQPPPSPTSVPQPILAPAGEPTNWLNVAAIGLGGLFLLLLLSLLWVRRQL